MSGASVQLLRVLAGGTLLMRADYTYFANDLVEGVRYGDPDGAGEAPETASVHYSYDAARRVTRIEHRDVGGGVLLALDYDYSPNDLPSSIRETGSTVGVGITITTTFAYDRLRRLKEEQRCRGTTSCDLLYYSREYAYDKGGNRLSMEAQDDLGRRLVKYHYDVHWAEERLQQNPYGSFNNRLEWSETLDISSGAPPYPTLATTWYYYSAAGNVTRIVTDPPPSRGGEYEAGMASGTVGTTAEGGVEALLVGGGGTGCPTGTNQYTATRFEYAKNGETVTYVLGERLAWWASATSGTTLPPRSPRRCWDQASPSIVFSRMDESVSDASRNAISSVSLPMNDPATWTGRTSRAIPAPASNRSWLNMLVSVMVRRARRFERIRRWRRGGGGCTSSATVERTGEETRRSFWAAKARAWRR